MKLKKTMLNGVIYHIKMPSIPTCVYMSREDTWSAIPSTTLLHRITRVQSSVRWIAVINIGRQQTIRVALGDPVRSTEVALHIPHWLVSDELYGEEILVRYERAEDYMKAKKLVFRVLSEPTDDDLSIQDFLEEPLSQLGVIEEGMCITVPVLEIPLLLEKIEPNGVPVFLDGAEVALEINWPEVEKKPIQKKVETKDYDFRCMLPNTIPGVSAFYK